MTINDPATPTLYKLHLSGVSLRDDLCGLLADARRWAFDVAETVGADDPRNRSAVGFAVEVAAAADEVAEGVDWLDRYPAEPAIDGWVDDLYLPSETVLPSGATDLFGDGRPAEDAEAERAQHVREADIVARAGALHARADLAHDKIHALDQKTNVWRDWTDQEGVAADEYSEHEWFSASGYAMLDALAHARSFEHDSTVAAPPASLPERSRDRFTARPVGRGAHADLASIAADSEQLLGDAITVKEQARPWFTATYNSIHVHEETYAGATLEAAESLDSTIGHLHSAINEVHWTIDPGAGPWRGPKHDPLSAEYDDGETRPYHISEHGIMASPADLSDEAAEFADATQGITWRLQGIDQRAHGWLTDAIDNEADHATLQRGARAVRTLTSTTAVSHITHRTFERSARTLADQPEEAADDIDCEGIRTAGEETPPRLRRGRTHTLLTMPRVHTTG